MGVFSKLKFWKKEDDLFAEEGGNPVFGTSADTTPGLGGTGSLGQYPDSETIKGPDLGLGQPGYSQYPRTVTAPQQAPSQTLMEKDLEIISSKLDAIKALVDHVNQRLENLERNAKTMNKGW